VRIGFDTIPSRVSQRFAQHHDASPYIYRYLYFLSLRFFFCFTKAVLHEAATFGNYSPPYAKRFLNLLYHTDRRSQTILPFFPFPSCLLFSFSLSLPLLFILVPPAVCTRREKCRLSYANFQNFPRDVYRLSFLLNLTRVRKREPIYVNLFFLALI